MGPARLDKALNSLAGLVEGIAIDGEVNRAEIGFLGAWLEENQELRDRHPCTELMPVLYAALDRGVLTEEERLDILWLCQQLRSTEYFDAITADMQRLHALLAGIISDGVVTVAELRGLAEWLNVNHHLKKCWPYDEVESLVTGVLSDGKIDDDEQRQLQFFFSEFVALADNRTIVNPKINEGQCIGGLCAVCPEVVFTGKKFCFTGASERYPRSALVAIVERLGGTVASSVTTKVDYLIIGADGNPCWAYACYGRKVAQAVELRKQGSQIQLIHELDFHDAVANTSSNRIPQ